MQKIKTFAMTLVTVLTIFFCLSTITVSAASVTLKEGMQGPAVTELQKNLKSLGYLNADATGYYGDLTVAAVKKLQKRYGLEADGKAGDATLSLIKKLLGKKTAVSRGEADRGNPYLVPWFGGAENIFAREKVATVYDIDTGLSFKIKRTFGTNHADCEALTSADTAIMRKVFGGTWNWDRRAVIVTVDGRKMAASMAGMPHAGNDSLPADTYVKSRSGGYGAGTNLDEVKGNGMSGHFDVHFLGSKTHSTNKVDPEHQAMVQKAAAWALKNL